MAPVALATAKGSRTHKRWGKVYLWCMGCVAATALPMALYRPVLFLALVAVFSFYLSFSGYRVLRLKDLTRGGNATFLDWTAAAVTFSASLCLALLGWLRPIAVQNMGIVAIIFGLVGMRAAAAEAWTFLVKPKDKRFWWYTHFGNFIGSYIAAWSAFSVVTLQRLLGNHLWLWLWPTAIGIPAIVLLSAYYKRRFTPKSPHSASAA